MNNDETIETCLNCGSTNDHGERYKEPMCYKLDELGILPGPDRVKLTDDNYDKGVESRVNRKELLIKGE